MSGPVSSCQQRAARLQSRLQTKHGYHCKTGLQNFATYWPLDLQLGYEINVDMESYTTWINICISKFFSGSSRKFISSVVT